MKTSTLILALAAAAIASINAQDLCSTTAVRGFLIDANAKACATAIGIDWKPFRPYNETEIAAYCKTPSCLTFLATLPPLNPVECKIPGGEKPLLYADLLDKVALCSSSSTPVPTTATPTPVPTTAAPATPEPTTPAPTTPAPTTPAPTTPAPTTAAPTTPAPTTPAPTTAAPTTPAPTTPAPTTPVPTTAAPTTPEPTTTAPTPAPTTATPVTPTVAPTTPEPTTPVKPSC